MKKLILLLIILISNRCQSQTITQYHYHIDSLSHWSLIDSVQFIKHIQYVDTTVVLNPLEIDAEYVDSTGTLSKKHIILKQADIFVRVPKRQNYFKILYRNSRVEIKKIHHEIK